MALRWSAEIGLSELYPLIAPYSKKDQKASAREISIVLPIHSLDSTLQLLDRDLEIAPTWRREDCVHRSSIDMTRRWNA